MSKKLGLMQELGLILTSLCEVGRVLLSIFQIREFLQRSSHLLKVTQLANVSSGIWICLQSLVH